jgi:hypothetical protein
METAEGRDCLTNGRLAETELQNTTLEEGLLKVAGKLWSRSQKE